MKGRYCHAPCIPVTFRHTPTPIRDYSVQVHSPNLGTSSATPDSSLPPRIRSVANPTRHSDVPALRTITSTCSPRERVSDTPAYRLSTRTRLKHGVFPHGLVHTSFRNLLLSLRINTDVLRVFFFSLNIDLSSGSTPYSSLSLSLVFVFWNVVPVLLLLV